MTERHLGGRSIAPPVADRAPTNGADCGNSRGRSLRPGKKLDMARAIVILLLAWPVAGCASGGWHPDDRQSLISEISSDDSRRSSWAMLDSPREEATATGASAQDPPAGRSRSNSTQSGQDRGQDKQGEEPKPSAWKRAEEETELAIIRDQMRQIDEHREHTRARVWGVNGYGQIGIPSNRTALEGFPIEDPRWDDLVKNGWGAGLDLSWEPMPLIQPFIGLQYSRNTDTSFLITDQTQYLNIETSALQMLPFYGGLRLNFPLNESISDWFSSSAAGLASGVIPYLRVAGGGAYNFGNEIEITDLSSPTTTKLDFINRGFTGYVEGEVGIEYRTKEGYAFRLSVGVQAYPGIRLDREFEDAYPNVDLKRLEMAILPRISATYYF